MSNLLHRRIADLCSTLWPKTISGASSLIEVPKCAGCPDSQKQYCIINGREIEVKANLK